jgi:hypothetical protein
MRSRSANSTAAAALSVRCVRAVAKASVPRGIVRKSSAPDAAAACAPAKPTPMSQNAPSTRYGRPPARVRVRMSKISDETNARSATGPAWDGRDGGRDRPAANGSPSMDTPPAGSRPAGGSLPPGEADGCVDTAMRSARSQGRATHFGSRELRALRGCPAGLAVRTWGSGRAAGACRRDESGVRQSSAMWALWRRAGGAVRGQRSGPGRH